MSSYSPAKQGPFTQFIASKPDKYGQRYWLVVDKHSKYFIKGFCYTGKDECRPLEQRVSEHVAMKLMISFLNKSWNVTTDNYFTSVTLLNYLKKNSTSLLETVKKIRREMPRK